MSLAADRPRLRLVLAGLALAGLCAGTAGAAAPAAQVRAIATYDGSVPQLSGLEVLRTLPTVRTLVVEGWSANSWSANSWSTTWGGGR